MAKVARSSAAQSNQNKLRFHKVKVFVQRYPGKFGSDEERSEGEKIQYTLYTNGRFAQSGNLEADGSVELYIPGGATGELEVLGTKYELETLLSLEPHNFIEGIQRRLRFLGYFRSEIDGEWDAEFDRAVLNFQADHGLDADGDAALAATFDKIKSEYGE